ncbi:MAG: exosortase/archaeosortase family protein, partial [Phycisphaerae bacterium]
HGNSDYSAGPIVVVIAAWLIWSRRKALKDLTLEPCRWGAALLVASQALRVYGLLFAYGSLERYSLVLTVISLCLWAFGWQTTRRLSWVLLFLFLAVPLPMRVHNSVSIPLQTFATVSAKFGLEMLGYIIEREGNVLRLSSQTTIAVAEACSGLRMLLAFVVVSATVAFIVRLPWWRRMILVASSIPIAVVANTLRLIVTALLFEHTSSELANRFFHDFAGVTMMPLALLLLMGELRLMRWLGAAPGEPVPVKR